MNRGILIVLILVLGVGVVFFGMKALNGEEKSSAANITITEEQAQGLDKAIALAAAVPFPVIDKQRRGCPSCHSLVDPETGKHTLAYEAHERTEVRGGKHPDKAPDGTSMKVTDVVSVVTCLLCHAPGKGDRAGKGVDAAHSLRDIVHPAHMSSQTFKLRYGGSCFNCHNINGSGAFEILTEAVDTNDKGVPNPDKLPIPGAIHASGLHKH